MSRRAYLSVGVNLTIERVGGTVNKQATYLGNPIYDADGKPIMQSTWEEKVNLHFKGQYITCPPPYTELYVYIETRKWYHKGNLLTLNGVNNIGFWIERGVGIGELEGYARSVALFLKVIFNIEITLDDITIGVGESY